MFPKKSGKRASDMAGRFMSQAIECSIGHQRQCSSWESLKSSLRGSGLTVNGRNGVATGI